MRNSVNRLPSLRTPLNSPFRGIPDVQTSQPVVNPLQRAPPYDNAMQTAEDAQVEEKPAAEGDAPAFPPSRRGHSDSDGAPDHQDDTQPSSGTRTLDMNTIAAQLDNMQAMWAMNTQLIMELKQEYAGGRPSHRGPVVFKQPPVRNHDRDRTLMLVRYPK